MSWQQWFLLGMFATSSLATVATIGRPRSPFTPLEAVIHLLISGALVALVVSL